MKCKRLSGKPAVAEREAQFKAHIERLVAGDCETHHLELKVALRTARFGATASIAAPGASTGVKSRVVGLAKGKTVVARIGPGANGPDKGHIVVRIGRVGILHIDVTRPSLVVRCRRNGVVDKLAIAVGDRRLIQVDKADNVEKVPEQNNDADDVSTRGRVECQAVLWKLTRRTTRRASLRLILEFASRRIH